MKQEKHEPQTEWEDLHTLFDKSFETIDKDIEEQTPSLEWFEQFTMNQQEALKQKYRKELAVFLIIAVLVISAILFALNQSILIFAVIQITAFAAAVGYGGVSYLKRVRRT
ncbi:hypothetical protein D3H55_16060 [Bacillus salacetis]|uniref:YxlC family protein n=1 Tax=Bacillus salacetis TaxID=2315464 RepID=A0A3A1QUP0_9BACI|nr:YxlC family protein [Bacillus salacetis]RIW30899.1 hypothetical protein D3H55_16060 [Bacillus salacetis]